MVEDRENFNPPLQLKIIEPDLRVMYFKCGSGRNEGEHGGTGSSNVKKSSRGENKKGAR